METKKQLREKMEELRRAAEVWRNAYQKMLNNEFKRVTQSPTLSPLGECLVCREKQDIAKRSAALRHEKLEYELRARISSLTSFISTIIEEYPAIVKHRADQKEDEAEKYAKKMTQLDYFLEGSGMCAEDVCDAQKG